MNKSFEEIDGKIQDLIKIKDVVKNILSKRSTKQLREFLQKEKAQGDTGDGEYCVVANYLREELGDCVDITVDNDNIIVDEIEIPCSKVVSKFVTNFDNGKYPELVE